MKIIILFCICTLLGCTSHEQSIDGVWGLTWGMSKEKAWETVQTKEKRDPIIGDGYDFEKNEIIVWGPLFGGEDFRKATVCFYKNEFYETCFSTRYSDEGSAKAMYYSIRTKLAEKYGRPKKHDEQEGYLKREYWEKNKGCIRIECFDKKRHDTTYQGKDLFAYSVSVTYSSLDILKKKKEAEASEI